jgi:hypothetical protein
MKRLLLCAALLGFAAAAGAGEELERVLGRVLAPPHIETAKGFRARVLVPPGELYDPLFMLPQDDGSVWLTDDGGEEEGREGRETTGSRIVAVDESGRVRVIVGTEKTSPMIAPGIAPASFGARAGQLIAFSQARAGWDGAFQPHTIQALDPKRGFAPETICTLPNAGRIGGGVAGVGADARFGPPGSPFADRFFAATVLNYFVYQLDARGRCTPFADFSDYGAPAGIGFSADGRSMFVAVSVPNQLGVPTSGNKAKGGVILRVSSVGAIDPKPVARGFEAPVGMAIAPPGFGAHGGELFVADAGAGEVPVPSTRPVAADGAIYRVTASGEVLLVASGMPSPTGLAFVRGALWVTDIAGDFIGGRRELPDGYIAVIEAE